jgi:micrococcal nuclease
VQGSAQIRTMEIMSTLKIIISILLLMIVISPSQAKFEQSTSTIIDGDTLYVTTLNSYRLAGIDAPEHDQPLGDKSAQKLKEILESGELVQLWCTPKPDKYGRDVCMVALNVKGIKVDPAEELLREGLAEVEYARYLPPANEAVYRMAEEEAKKQKLGLWGLKNYVKPYDWRHKQKQQNNLEY